MNCSEIPDSEAQEALELTIQTGDEHGFVVCDNGDVGDMIQGDESGMKVPDDACPADFGVFHTHPNGVLDLSDQDRAFLARDDVRMVCVGAGADMDEMRCERSQPACHTDLPDPDVPADENEAFAPPGDDSPTDPPTALATFDAYHE